MLAYTLYQFDMDKPYKKLPLFITYKGVKRIYFTLHGKFDDIII